LRWGQQFDLHFSPVLVKRKIAAIDADDTAMFASYQPNVQKEERMRSQSQFSKKMMALVTALMFFVVSSATRVEATASYDLTPAQIEAAVEEYFDSLASLDVQRFVNNFAPDGVFEDPVGTPPIQGTQAITAYVGAIFPQFREGKSRIQEVIVCGQEAAVNWKLRLKSMTGKVIIIDGMGIFKFNSQGKLQSVREFWDLAALSAQLQG
jgi:steroid Delta-isomerase